MIFFNQPPQLQLVLHRMRSVYSKHFGFSVIQSEVLYFKCLKGLNENELLHQSRFSAAVYQ